MASKTGAFDLVYVRALIIQIFLNKSELLIFETDDITTYLEYKKIKDSISTPKNPI
jgi:hypothetical protein